jgi:hypothetical protein
MYSKLAKLRTRLNLIGIFILLAGLAGAVLVYRAAAIDGGDAVDYDHAGGTVYALTPGASKSYRHDLELYGGKAALLADEFNRWFEALWQGRQLAYSLALLAIAVALACFWAAHALVEPSSPGTGEARDG